MKLLTYNKVSVSEKVKCLEIAVHTGIDWCPTDLYAPLHIPFPPKGLEFLAQLYHLHYMHHRCIWADPHPPHR